MLIKLTNKVIKSINIFLLWSNKYMKIRSWYSYDYQYRVVLNARFPMLKRDEN